MARYRVKKIDGFFRPQARYKMVPIWYNISENFFPTSDMAIAYAKKYIENAKDNGKVVWESKE